MQTATVLAWRQPVPGEHAAGDGAAADGLSMSADGLPSAPLLVYYFYTLMGGWATPAFVSCDAYTNSKQPHTARTNPASFPEKPVPFDLKYLVTLIVPQQMWP